MAQESSNKATPNVIGNVEDMPDSQLNPGQSYPSLNNLQKADQVSVGANSSEFKDITPNLMRRRPSKSKTGQTL